MTKKMNSNANNKRVTRTEMNRLMAIPEVRQIIEAKFAELRLLFKDKLQEPDELELAFSDNNSNIIRFPLLEVIGAGSEMKPKPQDLQGKNQRENMGNLIKIVDASRYRSEPEEEQVNIFMEYFENHKVIRKAVLDEFFLRILPYSDIGIENG
ncbi:MAG: hypothetical protein GTO45_23625 [Candidatus Aminicenantes bacterium]|nr:hypothetical protein [Candidatus Aminicenantes bacterium]NIM81748.1 hypothetical protein [Candidatus Aminicenantes bacterium]NIN21120.1 hypothetical protein [Candidatus Aminicenantes bacterium]NIN44942.1 hypothetical protein [Candidatus Aminicenantes bacterium]NIN87756.1 hypothetical protein [Candidatus Aminicenantes bacterium]